MSSHKATPEQQAANLAALKELQKLFPNLQDNEVGDWLINCTAFPFAELEHCLVQARALALRSNGDHELAMKMAYDDLDKEMAKVGPTPDDDFESGSLVEA